MTYQTTDFSNHLKKINYRNRLGTVFTVLFIFFFSMPAKADILSPSPDIIVIPHDETNASADNAPELSDGLRRIKNNLYFYKSGSMQTGWQETGGHTYYFSKKTGAALKGKQKLQNNVYYFGQDGTMQTGWQQINGKNYYFNPSGAKKGCLRTDCIAGTKNTGIYYTDKDGIRVTSPEISAAVAFVKKYTNDSLTSAEKLRKCFEALQNHYYYLPSQESPTDQTFSSFAAELLTNEKGNCYRYAAGFACIAKVLGYESRIRIGTVSGRYEERLPHGWSEVKANGTWYKCDVNMNLFMHKGTTSHKYQCSETYKLLIEEGIVYWK